MRFCRVFAWLHPIILESIEVNDSGSLFFSAQTWHLGSDQYIPSSVGLVMGWGSFHLR